MSDLQYASYPGFGEYALEHTLYSQAVIVPPGPIITISGQGGWTPEAPFTVDPDMNIQVNQAFSNVDLALRTAGGKGWSQVYKIRIFTTAWDEGYEPLLKSLKKWCGDNKPTMTVIGVDKLAFDMKMEIEVDAHLGDSN
jgi:enamine deaminase RidA (YjgF/YER057c/UK114 family)